MVIDRYIRLRDAPGYLGMDKDRFNQEVRPYLVEIPIGIQGIAFDRLDLDAWADEYKSRNGRPGRGEKLWDVKAKPLASSGGVRFGTSKKGSKKPPAGGFEKALAQVTCRKRSAT